MTRFQQIRSVRPLSGTLIAGEKLIRVDRPANREQRQNGDNGQYFHGLKVVLDCGQKRLRFVHFRDDPGKDRDRPAPSRRRLKRDDLRMNRHRALAYCSRMIFSENRCTLFRIMR
jgi:hypothetical protein